MKKLKVVTIMGTRPEIIRLSRVISYFDTCFDHKVIHTGQNWDPNLSSIFFDEMSLRAPDFQLKTVGKHLGETIGNIIAQTYELLAKEKPDAVLILGDTNSALAAISAKRLKIPIFHMEAGNRCFDTNVPEEINRKLVDHLADINLTYTEHGRRYLLSEGAAKERVFVTGSPMTEVLDHYKDKIAASKALDSLGLKADKYIVVSCHREENVDFAPRLERLTGSINGIAEEFGLPVIFSAHPRTKAALEKHKITLHKNVKISQPLGFFDYVKLEMNSFCVLSDSGTLSEESAISGFPAVLVRDSTERPEALDTGTVAVGGIDRDELIAAVKLRRAVKEQCGELRIPEDYRDKTVSLKVANFVMSFTRIIDNKVWNKRELGL